MDSAYIDKNQDDDELKKKRDEYSTEIRRQTREEFFKKKRNLLDFSEISEANAFNGNNSLNNQTNAPLNVHETLNELADPETEKLRIYVNECLKRTFTMEDFPGLVDNIMSKDVTKQHLGVIGLRKVLSIEDSPPIQPVIDANLVPRLLEFMHLDSLPHLQLESAWALTNVASGTTQQTQTIIDKQGIPAFVRLLSSKHPEVAEQAIWAIGNIAGDSADFRNMILKCGGINPLIQIIYTSENKSTIKHGTWALSNLCRGKPLPDYDLVKDALPVLAKVLLTQDDPEVITDATWALSYLSDGQEDRIQTVLQTNCVGSITKQLASPLLSILIPSLRTLGNLITGTDYQTTEVLKTGALEKFFALLSHEKRAVRREACWTISNITAGSSDHIALVVANPIYIEKLITLMNTDSAEVKREAAWVVSNATNRGSSESIATLVQYGVLDTFVNLLESDDVKTVAVVLEGIKNILACGAKAYVNADGENLFLNKLEALGGIPKLENLQTHPNQEIYDKCLQILETYFETEAPF